MQPLAIEESRFEPVRFEPKKGERLIFLTRGYEAIIDEADYPLVSKYSWRVQFGRNTCYAASQEPGTRKKLYMHRMVAQARTAGVVDHWDFCGLNNRRKNLRVCGFGSNAQNMNAKFRISAAGFRGVDKRGHRWRAKLKFDGQYQHIGYYDSPIEAALAYDEAVLRLYGPHAWTNFNNDRFDPPMEHSMSTDQDEDDQIPF